MRRREGARERFARALSLLVGEKNRDGFFEASLEDVAKTVIGYTAESRHFCPRRQVITMDCGDEEQRTDSFVEIDFTATVDVERLGRSEQRSEGSVPAPRVECEVARRRVGGLDQVDDACGSERGR